MPEGALTAAAYARPYAWWGWHWSPPVPLSIVEIVSAGTIDRRVAAVLWLLLGSRRSLLLASDPPMSGKTTLLSALLPFLPDETSIVFLRGLSETFDYTREGDPRSTYLLVNELSSHLPVYLWGRKATQMFRTLREGYGCGATMHADDVEGVLAQLRGELALEDSDLACLDVIGIMRVIHGSTPIVGHEDIPPELRYGRETIRRRVVAAHLVVPGDDGIETPLFAEWDPASDSHRMRLEPVLPELARRTGRTVEAFCDALIEREAFLADLERRGIRRPRAVADAIGAYAERQHPPEGQQ